MAIAIPFKLYAVLIFLVFAGVWLALFFTVLNRSQFAETTCKVVSLQAVSDALSGDGLQYLQRTVVIEYSKGAQTILAEACVVYGRGLDTCYPCQSTDTCEHTFVPGFNYQCWYSKTNIGAVQFVKPEVSMGLLYGVTGCIILLFLSTTLVVYRVKFPKEWDPLSEKVESAREIAALVNAYAENSADQEKLLAHQPPSVPQHRQKGSQNEQKTNSAAKAPRHFT